MPVNMKAPKSYCSLRMNLNLLAVLNLEAPSPIRKPLATSHICLFKFPLNKVKLEIQFPSCSSHISSAQEHLANDTYRGQSGHRPSLPLWKVLQDSTVLVN